MTPKQHREFWKVVGEFVKFFFYTIFLGFSATSVIITLILQGLTIGTLYVVEDYLSFINERERKPLSKILRDKPGPWDKNGELKTGTLFIPSFLGLGIWIVGVFVLLELGYFPFFNHTDAGGLILVVHLLCCVIFAGAMPIHEKIWAKVWRI